MTRSYRFEIFKGVLATPALWYWRIVASNGKIVADGAESYAKEGNAKRAVEKFKAEMHDMLWRG